MKKRADDAQLHAVESLPVNRGGPPLASRDRSLGDPRRACTGEASRQDFPRSFRYPPAGPKPTMPSPAPPGEPERGTQTRLSRRGESSPGCDVASLPTRARQLTP
jgi:hypothetical protein